MPFLRSVEDIVHFPSRLAQAPDPNVPVCPRISTRVASRRKKIPIVGALARLLLCYPQMLFSAICFAALCSACILPPELEVGGFDAGPGASPVIVSAGPAPEFSFPGPILLDRQDTRTLSLTAVDNDLDDVLHVRLYVDYGLPNPQPAYSECQAAPTGEPSRVLACPMNSICNSIGDTDQGDHVLEAMIADREFISDSDPLAEDQPQFRALRDPGRAAFSLRSWLFRCNAPAEI